MQGTRGDDDLYSSAVMDNWIPISHDHEFQILGSSFPHNQNTDYDIFKVTKGELISSLKSESAAFAELRSTHSLAMHVLKVMVEFPSWKLKCFLLTMRSDPKMPIVPHS